jgi:hypothetical protein
LREKLVNLHEELVNDIDCFNDSGDETLTMKPPQTPTWNMGRHRLLYKHVCAPRK